MLMVCGKLFMIMCFDDRTHKEDKIYINDCLSRTVHRSGYPFHRRLLISQKGHIKVPPLPSKTVIATEADTEWRNIPINVCFCHRKGRQKESILPIKVCNCLASFFHFEELACEHTMHSWPLDRLPRVGLSMKEKSLGWEGVDLWISMNSPAKGVQNLINATFMDKNNLLLISILRFKFAWTLTK